MTAGSPKETERTSGSLVVVGSGIRALHQMTVEARGRIASADKVFYAVCDPITEEWIDKACPAAENLLAFYAEGKNRLESYDEMIDAIMNDVRGGLRVCAVFYVADLLRADGADGRHREEDRRAREKGGELRTELATGR
jgi:hypothetical protein